MADGRPSQRDAMNAQLEMQTVPTPADGAPPKHPLSQLEEAIGYQFSNEDLLRAALVHKSFLHDVQGFVLGSNERLEFLGDAVLNLVVSANLFLAHPDLPEGQLSSLRGALVRLSTLAEIAAPIELGQYMYMSRGEEVAGGRERMSNTGRAVEALLGAVYLDGGLGAAASAWKQLGGERGLEQLELVLSEDYKSKLQQFVQAELRLTPSYRIVGTTGPEHEKIFQVEVYAGSRVLASGQGRNKQSAEQVAAKEALIVLEAV
ncbi:MAG: ribonuclease III [Chloroflexia bacterium]